MIDFVSICSNACQSIPNPLHFLDNHPNKSQEKTLLEEGGGYRHCLCIKREGVWPLRMEMRTKGGRGSKKADFSRTY